MEATPIVETEENPNIFGFAEPQHNPESFDHNPSESYDYEQSDVIICRTNNIDLIADLVLRVLLFSFADSTNSIHSSRLLSNSVEFRRIQKCRRFFHSGFHSQSDVDVVPTGMMNF